MREVEWLVAALLMIPLMIDIMRSAHPTLVIVIGTMFLLFWMLSTATWFMVSSLLVCSVISVAGVHVGMSYLILLVVSIGVLYHVEVASTMGFSRLGVLPILSLSQTLSFVLLAIALSFIVYMLAHVLMSIGLSNSSLPIFLIGLATSGLLAAILIGVGEEEEGCLLMIRTTMKVGTVYSFEVACPYERGISIEIKDSGRELPRLLSFSLEWKEKPPSEIVLVHRDSENVLKKRGELKGNGRRVILYG